MDPFAEMTLRQVERREDRLLQEGARILRELGEADGDEGMPLVSRETGVDLRPELERWRHWKALRKEMRRAGADCIGDLGPSRIEHWRVALNDDNFRPGPPLRAYRPVEPRIRHVALPAQPPPPRLTRGSRQVQTEPRESD